MAARDLPIDRRLGTDRRTGRDRRAMPRICVIPLSAGGGEWWTDLAADVEIIVDVLQPDVDVQPPEDTIAVLLAASGAPEHAVEEWIRDHRLPRALPVIAVGADRARRRALDIVAAGAANYFAL